MNEHESNLIIGVRLLDSAVAVLQAVDFSKVANNEYLASDLAMHNLLAELNYLNSTYSTLLTGDPE